MLYKKLLKFKEDTQNITDLEATDRYLCSLERTPTFHVQVLQRVFVEFGNSYTFWMFTTILKSWNLLTHTMRLVP
jgi:hypothetical protein